MLLPPAPVACAAFAAGLHSPSRTAGAFLTFTMERCGNAAVEPPSLMYHQVWLALPFLRLLHSHLLAGPAQKFCTHTMQIGFQCSPCPSSQASPKSSLFHTDSSQDRPVSRACWAQPSAQEGEAAAVPCR